MALFGLGKKLEAIEKECGCGCDCKISPSSETISDIKILGGGCAKCNQLEKATKEALSSLGMSTDVEHITDYTDIAAYGVMSTPALVIDNKVVSTGIVLKVEEVVKILKEVR